MAGELARMVRDMAEVPLAWAGGTSVQNYLNLGDALSPVMTGLLAGKPVRRVPFRSETSRLVAVGTIGQNIIGGRAWFWGTGCSPRAGSARRRVRFTPDPGLRAEIVATRGPLSAALLGGGRLTTRTFGDPVWLLPRFYDPRPPKRWELGVIPHLSDLADREVACHPKPALARYVVPEALAGTVRLINTVCPISLHGMRAKLDEILSCRRLISTSLHGLVFAESYGIPCLYFPPIGPAGPVEAPLAVDMGLDDRMLDLYMGLGRQRLAYYAQPHDAPTDWEAVIAAVDRLWSPAVLDGDALMAAFPLDLNPVRAAPDGAIWDHPALTGTTYAHDVAALVASDAAQARATARVAESRDEAMAKLIAGWRLPAVLAPAAPPPTTPRPATPYLRRGADGRAEIALYWAAPPPESPIVNLGDALSPVMVAALSGAAVRRVGARSRETRLVGVGTIGHGVEGGVAHFWGTGFDEAVAPAAPRPTERVVHAVRGPFTAAALRRRGAVAPEIFGDPVCFIDRVFPMKGLAKTCDLGIVLHMSELRPERRPAPPPRASLLARLGLTGRRPVADPETVEPAAGSGPHLPQYRRYDVPDALRGRVRLIEMYAGRTLQDMRDKLAEIASCRAILSTSLHGLVIAEAYGVPSAWFGFEPGGLREVDPMDLSQTLDHRVRDLYAGQGLARVPVLTVPREEPLDWAAVLRDVRQLPLRRPDARALFEAFPGPRVARWDEPVWPVSAALL